MAKRVGEAAKAQALREERDRVLRDTVIESATKVRRKLDQAAELAAEKLVECVQGNGPITTNGSLDSAYVQALRLALQAGGALVERQDVTTKGEQVATAAFVVPPKDAE